MLGHADGLTRRVVGQQVAQAVVGLGDHDHHAHRPTEVVDRAGRAFAPQEVETGARVVVIGSEVASYYFDRELESRIKKFTTMLEPLMIVMVGLIVGFVAVALVLLVSKDPQQIWLVLAAVLISAVNAIVRKAFDVSSNAFLETQWYLFSAIFLLGRYHEARHAGEGRPEAFFTTYRGTSHGPASVAACDRIVTLALISGRMRSSSSS